MDSTTAFFTIDPMISDRLVSVFDALSGGDWEKLITEDDDLLIRLLNQGVENPEDRENRDHKQIKPNIWLFRRAVFPVLLN